MSQLEFNIFGRPDYALLEVKLQPGQKVFAEASVMVSMDTNVRMITSMKGGLWQSLKRSILSGESMFINEFIAEGGPGEVTFAAGPIGDLNHYRVEQGKVLYLQSSAYVASSEGIHVNTQWDGFRGFFSGMGLFLLRIEGEGDVFFNGFGGLLEIPVDGSFVVDTGCVAAFESSLQYHVRPIGGIKTTFLGGELFVCSFHGQGKVWVQTRSVPPFAAWLDPFRPERSSD